MFIRQTFSNFNIAQRVKYLIPTIFLLLANTGFCASDSDLIQHDKGIWSIQGTTQKTMWIVIHNLQEARETGIYHIEVLAKGIDAPAWDIEHFIKHIAITQSALAKSVLKPLNKGAVYPETFDDAYKDWQNLNSGQGGPVCTSNLSDCMQKILHDRANPDDSTNNAAE